MFGILFFLSIFDIFVILYYATYWLKSYKQVYIVRGLPGSGKTYFIQHLITNKLIHDNFISIGFKDFFDGNPRNVPKAYNKCFGAFMNEIYTGRHVIFIDNPNIELWEYENYIIYAQSKGYKVQVIEIDCPDERYLEYFYSRSNSKMSEELLKSQYQRWEKDCNSLIIEPYVEINLEENGDSLPYPKVTKEELDKDMDDYSEKMKYKIL